MALHNFEKLSVLITQMLCDQNSSFPSESRMTPMLSFEIPRLTRTSFLAGVKFQANVLGTFSAVRRFLKFVLD